MGLYNSKADLEQGRELSPENSVDPQTTNEERSKIAVDGPEHSTDYRSDLPEKSRECLSDQRLPLQRTVFMKNTTNSPSDSSCNKVSEVLGKKDDRKSLENQHESNQKPKGNGADIYSSARFRQEIEIFFANAESAISKDRFDLDFAKNWILHIRAEGCRYTNQGCTGTELEEIIVNRALNTVDRLVDGVQKSQEEVFDPLQTLVYLYCAMAVCSSTVELWQGGSGGVMYHLSLAGSSCFPQLDILYRYCYLKTTFEGQPGWHNMVVHNQLLFDLAAWLEVGEEGEEARGRRAPVSFLIANRTMGFLSFLLASCVKMAASDGEGLQQWIIIIRDRIQWLRHIGVVLSASSLVRQGFVRQAEEYSAELAKVDTSHLSPALATRHSFVTARLLHNRQEYTEALHFAREAQRGAVNAQEKGEMEALVNEVRTALKDAVSQGDISGPIDKELLKEVHADLRQARTEQQDAIRHQHTRRKKSKRHRKKRVSDPKRGETPSMGSTSHRPHGATPEPLGSSLRRTSTLSSSTPTLSTHGSSAMSICSSAPGHHGSAVFSSRDSLFSLGDGDEIDDDDDDDDSEPDVDREIRFFYSSDEDDECQFKCMQGSEEDQQDWFEKSEQAIAEGVVAEVEEEAIGLSQAQDSDFERGAEGRAFYPNFYSNAQELLKNNPIKYKRCQLKIERAHKAVAKILDKGSRYTEILIDGRSKAGRTFMDDEVVVEILAEADGKNGAKTGDPKDKAIYGKVVGLLKRVTFANEPYPVMFCTLDEIEGHLMKPLCKSVPKIHVMNDKVKHKFPTLLKSRIEIKTVGVDGRVYHKRFIDVQPDKREQYVFKVVLLAWRQRNIYPLGAVLEAYMGGKDYSSGLQVLCMQHRVPKLYPRAAVEDAKRIVEKGMTSTGRVDLTSERLFTVDPPGSRDLDDAISIRSEGEHVVIAVHIADVAAVVSKGSGVDLEARRRAFTFYPLHRKPHCMLPEPLSQDHCSLLPAKPRLAFSVFFRFNHKGTLVGDPEIKRTLIRSQQQLTYEQVQRVIDGHAEDSVDLPIQEDILKIHKVTAMLQDKRKKDSVLFIPFEDPRLLDLEQLNECMEAHSLIEELMILTNQHVANFLTRRPQLAGSMIVRCHKAPTWQELRQWQREEGSVTDLVLQLQGQQVTPSTHLSFHNKLEWRGQVVVQRQVWKQLCRYLEKGQVEQARRLAFMDGLHPLQSLAAGHWMNMMQTAEYTSAQGNGLRHFGLNLPIYTHFTSPIRRYPDLHVQRIMHAALDGKATDCNPSEVLELCQHINSVSARQKAFSKGCQTIKMADSLQRQPLVFRAYVDAVDEEQLTLSLPSLRALPDRKQELSFSMLGVSSQPEMLTDTVGVTVQWKRRFYDVKGKCPESLKHVWKDLNKLRNMSPSSPVVIKISPEQESISLKQQDWVKILQKLSASGEGHPWGRVPQPISRDQSEVEYMSLEKGDDTVSQRPVYFRRTYTRGQVVKLQLSAEPRKGMLKPRTDILHTAINACMCTLHVSEPVLALTRHATRATRDKQFSSYKDYIKAWMPLLEMEAAVGAGEGETSVIDRVLVTMKPQASTELPYRGFFTLGANFCSKRYIEFGGKSTGSIREDEVQNMGDLSFPLDYLCLRYQTDCHSTLVSRVRQSKMPESVDEQYTWLAHASVVEVRHRGRSREDGGQLTVTFVLSPSCSSQTPPPPPQLLSKQGAEVTLELLPKSEVDRRAQELLIELQNPDLTLARAIAFGSKFPKLEFHHMRLGLLDENHEVIIPNSKKLPPNNKTQMEAIKKALTGTVTMIQGPPGSGKTNTGIKLVYLFCKINRQLQAEGKGRKTVLYCGPSNKSVDLVARELISKLGTEYCPKIVRVYGSAIESKDYPVPRGDLKSTRALRDLTSDPDLQMVALHHLIRQVDKPYAKVIQEYETLFDKCHSDPEKHPVTDRQLRKYYKLLFDASVEELQHYEVVLATCAVGGNRRVVAGVSESVYQLIIDECAMSPEPQSMVPIVATQPKQVVLIGDHKQLRPIIKCQPAAELGLDQSLFERLFQRFPAHTVFLNKQYRMHPYICAFPSQEFYDDGLETGHSSLWGGELLPFWPQHPDFHQSNKQVPHLLVNVKGEEEMLTVSTDQGNERSKSNLLEAEKVIEIVKFLKREFDVDLLKVKILTQYNAQRHLLEEKLKETIGQNMDIFDHYDRFKVKVSTVVSSQGGEWDYVILSTVRSMPSYKIEPNPTHGWCRQNLGFITDRNQVNVALTRARRGLIIVGNVELLRCDDVWRHLVERYQKLGCCVDDPDQFPPPPTVRHSRNRAHPRGQHNPAQSSRR